MGMHIRETACTVGISAVYARWTLIGVVRTVGIKTGAVCSMGTLRCDGNLSVMAVLLTLFQCQEVVFPFVVTCTSTCSQSLHRDIGC